MTIYMARSSEHVRRWIESVVLCPTLGTLFVIGLGTMYYFKCKDHFSHTQVTAAINTRRVSRL